MNPLASLAPAIKDLASAQRSSFATTQAVWRFLNNDKISFSQLNQPIEQLACEQINSSQHRYALIVHDWSQLQYVKHNHKTQRLQKTHQYDSGYELQTSLLVDAASGLPIAPLAQTLSDASGCYSTFSEQHTECRPHLDSLAEQIQKVEHFPLEKTCVHIIDREGDSIAHLRELSGHGFQWLIRAKEGNRIEHQDKICKVAEVAERVETQQVQPISYKGNQHMLHVGETDVRLTRAAKPKKKDDSGQRVAPQPGEAIAARLIVAVVKDAQDKTVARWSLISNVPSEIDAVELTTWYYWRWTIECYFKLLKQAGHDIEAWLQTTPEAILRRLLISSMACVLTWRIQRSEDEHNQKIRIFLACLSGRQQKRGKIESAPAILAGLSILLSTLQLLSEYSIDELNEIATIALGT
ncbi:transposase [Acinetobacter schindleri]|uniref:transposase n=1 Tax=Acinetobacter schindleri TaxID=108981 RepID=UPI0040467FDB